jgi:xyloglucan-specific exo-beta-1,4-glucanase
VDFANNTNWHDWCIDAIATEPVNPENLYIAVGMYTNSWDPNNGSILRSSNQGATWEETKLTFKVGGNMPGRGIGEVCFLHLYSGSQLMSSSVFR